MTEPTQTRGESEDTASGFAFALTAYGLWGILPLYMKLLDHLPVVEVLAHRAIWSIPIAGVVLIALKRTKDLRRALGDPATLKMAALTASLVSINWGIYVWAILNGQALAAALGYYINPLFSVALGALILGERLTKIQLVAIALAASAVVVLTVRNGSLPIAALGITLSWGLYAFFRKTLPIGPNQGFMLEVLLLLPLALVYLLWLAVRGEGHFATNWRDTWLFLGSGVVTAVPLMIYANGAKRLRLATIGLLQYIVPTLVFLLAVFLFDEPFRRGEAIAFPMIWAALILYTGSMLHHRRARG